MTPRQVLLKFLSPVVSGTFKLYQLMLNLALRQFCQRDWS